MERFERTREGIISLYQQLKDEVIAFIKDKQGKKGYIDTQSKNGNDTIFAILYDWDLEETTEQYVYGVRVIYDCLEVALQPFERAENEIPEWTDEDFKETQWKSVSENSSDTYFRITLDSIAENIGEYVD